MTRRKLPIGIQTFAKLREDDCYYVDKTGFALRLIDEGTHYFLSRPRRFGKSLFLDTLAELFAGNEPLFCGLQAHGQWDWGRRFPVIRLSFGGGVVQSRAELDRSIRAQLGRNRHNLRISCADPDDIASCSVFAPELDGLDRQQVRDWYNGYNWTGEAVYNPFDVLLLFDKRLFRPWWFETATPTFLVDLLLKRQVSIPRLGQLVASEALLSTFDVDHIATEALLFQTGYLTIGVEFSRERRSLVAFDVESLPA